ncbi:MAG: hypothetical protein AAGD06_06185 [Acidobacteriota bacterium]
MLQLLSDGRGGDVLAPALPVVFCHAALLVLFDLGRWPWATIGLLAVAFAAWGAAARRLENRPVPVVAILIVTAVLRLLLLPVPPTLSDDVLRYVWDGRVVTAGFNPYLLAPEAEELGELRDERWRRMPHKEVPTVYPPLALAGFTVASWTPSPILGWKILLLFADLAGCGLLVILARRLGQPSGRAIWYAWCPLVSLETAAMGHVDALMVTFMLVTAWALMPSIRRSALAGAAAACGVLAKLVPLVALPLWTRASPHRVLFAATAAAVLVAAVGPAAVATGVPPGLVTYGVSWEFNGPLYEPLWRALDAPFVVDGVKSGIDALKGAVGHHEALNRLYPFVYPQFLAKLILAGLFALLFLRILVRGGPPVTTTGRLLGAVVLCAATVYPWYLLWVLPWAALARQPAWLTLAALAPLSYLPQHADGVALFPWVWGLIWIPFGLLLIRHPTWSTD